MGILVRYTTSIYTKLSTKLPNWSYKEKVVTFVTFRPEMAYFGHSWRNEVHFESRLRYIFLGLRSVFRGLRSIASLPPVWWFSLQRSPYRGQGWKSANLDQVSPIGGRDEKNHIYPCSIDLTIKSDQFAIFCSFWKFDGRDTFRRFGPSRSGLKTVFIIALAIKSLRHLRRPSSLPHRR